MSFSNQALAAEYLALNVDDLEAKIYPLPEEIDAEVARIKLEHLEESTRSPRIRWRTSPDGRKGGQPDRQAQNVISDLWVGGDAVQACHSLAEGSSALGAGEELRPAPERYSTMASGSSPHSNMRV